MNRRSLLLSVLALPAALRALAAKKAAQPSFQGVPVEWWSKDELYAEVEAANDCADDYVGPVYTEGRPYSVWRWAK